MERLAAVKSLRGQMRNFERWLLHPVNGVRSWVSRGFEVGVSSDQVPRGGQLDGFVTISAAQRLESVEVGVVCTEFYAVTVCSSEGGSSRGISSAVAHEAWIPVGSTPGVHPVRLRIPEDAPYSYEGDVLSFRWEVAARGRRKKGIDPRAERGIWVLP